MTEFKMECDVFYLDEMIGQCTEESNVDMLMRDNKGVLEWKDNKKDCKWVVFDDKYQDIYQCHLIERQIDAELRKE